MLKYLRNINKLEPKKDKIAGKLQTIEEYRNNAGVYEIDE